MLPSEYDLVVVGAGFYGLTIAHKAANILGKKVLMLERRSHTGGNAHSAVDTETGIEAHIYGSHLFHCNSEEIWRYLNQFTPFTDYRHHVLTTCRGKIYPMPINLGTICSFFERAMGPDEARRLIATQAGQAVASQASNLEEKAIALIGRPLYEAFIRGYTLKQWQTDPRELPADIITRLPVRYTFNARYFDDRFEGLPSEGYHTIFRRMADHPYIHIALETDFFAIREKLLPHVPIIYTGPIDRYFNYTFGALAWRTLDFERIVAPIKDYQGTSVMNYADEDIPYTRIHEFKHLHPERKYMSDKTLLFREYSRFAQTGDEPYYPVNTSKDHDTMDKYRALATQEKNVIFGGRLGTYRYLDMHQAIGAAFKVFEKSLMPFFKEQRPLGNNHDF